MEFTKTKLMSMMLFVMFCSRMRNTAALRSWTGKAGLSTAYFAKLALRLDKNCCSTAHVMDRFLSF